MFVPINSLSLSLSLSKEFEVKTEKRLRPQGGSPVRISVVRLHRSSLHFLTHILSLQIATLYKLCCNEKSCSMLKSLFLEEFAELHLNMAGFLEMVQRSHTGGSLIPYMWDQ